MHTSGPSQFGRPDSERGASPPPSDAPAPGGRTLSALTAGQFADAMDVLNAASIPSHVFRKFSELIARHFGIKVGENKRTLVSGRIHPMLEECGVSSYEQLLDAIAHDGSGRLLSELANRISTNHTAFYREESHFAALRDMVLPDIVDRKRTSGDLDIRAWCAACATGEEAYTILFTLLKFLGGDYANWRAGLLATDISAEALDTARRGVYDADRMRPVPFEVKNMFFDRLDADTFRVKQAVRDEATFRRLNLNNPTYPFRKRFDFIFCRNVMIYFSQPIRLSLLEKLHEWLEPGGFLFVGHSESMIGSRKGYDYIAPALYRRV